MKFNLFRKLKIGLFLLSFLCLGACAKTLYVLMVPQKPHPKKMELCSQEKCRSIVFIPMVHIAKPKFYKAVKKKVTSLKSKGYIVFYEGADWPENTDSLTLDTLKRKVRKLAGVVIGDYSRNIEAYSKFFSNGNYVFQSPENSGYSKKTDIRVDLKMVEVINKYKKRYGTINLSSCDWDTDLEAKYLCDKAEHSDYAIYTIRNNHISKEVLKSKYDKIIMLYGKNHFKPIRSKLEKAGFQEIN